MKKLISILLLGVIIIGMVGCGGTSSEQSVENFFEKLKNVEIDKSTMTEEEKQILVYLEENFPKELKALKKKFIEIMKNVDVEIISSEETEETAKVNVKIKAIDASEFFVKFVGEMFTRVLSEALSNTMSGDEEFSDQQIYKLTFEILNDSLKEVEFKTVDRDYTIELKKVDKDWKIIDEEALGLEIMNIDSSQYEKVKGQLNDLT